MIHHCEETQWCGVSIQASRFHENPFFDSCSLLEPCYAFVIPRKVPKSISPVEINGEKIGGGRNYWFEDMEYFIHWQGYNVNEDTWGSTRHLSTVMEYVKKLH
jgi:hypothetical protein